MDLKAKIKVSELVQYLKKKVDQDKHLINLKVYGEISNLKKSYNNYIYFDLKDNNSKINCVIFKNSLKNLDFELKDGLKVNVIGSVKVYALNSSFQIIVDQIEEDGLGNLYLEFEKNKRELEKQGYFDEKYKQKIPKFPNRIAVISGNNSAALKDTLTTLNKRYKLSQVYVFLSLVQGKLAPKQIIDHIELINKHPFDVILLVRGGGSFEDLNAFNDVALAKTIFNSKIPIVTGIGHEVDYTIADFVSDHRALTPTAAAIKVSPNTEEVLEYLLINKNNISKKFNYQLINYFQNIDMYRFKIDKLFNNNFELNRKSLEYYQKKLEANNVKVVIDKYRKTNLEYYYQLMNQFDYILNKERYALLSVNEKLENVFKQKIINYKQELNELIIKLNLLDPNNVLDKGYSILKHNDHVIRDFSSLKKGDYIEIVNNEYRVKAHVDEVERNGK